MHDLDRTKDIFESDLVGQEIEALGEGPGDSGLFGEVDQEAAFDESEEIDLASELLGVGDEMELDQFLGDLVKKAGRAAQGFLKSSTGRALTGILKNAARKALPIAGKAIGGFIGGPLGASLGGKLASGAGRYFGLELEGLSGEDADFEVARRFVRFAGAAAKKAAAMPPAADPVAAAKSAVVRAARQFAPGLLGAAAGGAPSDCRGAGRSGRWVRRGRKIILYGI